MRKALLALIVVFFLSISTITSVAEAQTASPLLSTLRLIKVQPLRGLVSTPLGYLHVIVYYYQIMNDGDPNYNYFLYEVVVQSVPGKVVFNNAWEVTRVEACFSIRSAGSSFIDYSPTTTSGGQVASAAFGIKGFIGGSIPLPWLGSLNWVTVRDVSNLGGIFHRVCWHVLFNTWQDPPNAPSDSSYLMRFTFIIQALSGSHILVTANFRICFQDAPWRSEVPFSPSPVYLDIYSSETVVDT